MSPRKASGDLSEKASSSPSQTSPCEGGAAGGFVPSLAKVAGEAQAMPGAGSAALSGVKRAPQQEPPPATASTQSIPAKIEEDTEPPHGDVLPT